MTPRELPRLLLSSLGWQPGSSRGPVPGRPIAGPRRIRLPGAPAWLVYLAALAADSAANVILTRFGVRWFGWYLAADFPIGVLIGWAGYCPLHVVCDADHETVS